MVKRNFAEVYTLFENLKEMSSASDLLDEMVRVMSSDQLADVLEDVADNWSVEVNYDGSIDY